MISNISNSSAFLQSNRIFESIKEGRQIDKVSKTNKKATELKRMLSKIDNNSSDDSIGKSMAEAIYKSTKSYGESIRNQRINHKNNEVKIRKHYYNFKDISSRILRSRTSYSARQVVGQAMREVQRLKDERRTGKYQNEEIDAAIMHAKDMEIIAKRKVKHLEEEELSKISSGIFNGLKREDKEEETSLEMSINENYSKSQLSSCDLTESDLFEDDLFQGSELSTDAINKILNELEDLSENLMEEMSDEMKNFMEELDLSFMSDSSLAPDKDLTTEELDETKIKHRNKEMKDIVKADAKYLKAIFEYLDKMKAGNTGSEFSRTTSSTVQVSVSLNSNATFSESGIDISL